MISIVTPVYNGEKFIEACIQVVIAQGFPDSEHIIVDGKSTDETVEIIRQYAETYSHIRWISEKDRGQSDAMNKGIAMARGDILGILNVDDDYEPGVFKRVADIFQSLPVPAFLVGNCNVWDDDGNLLYINRPRRMKLFQLLLGPMVCPYPINPSAYFCHTALIAQTGKYNETYHMELDVDFILRAVQVAHVKYCDETWGNFRLLQGTKTWKDVQSGTDRAAHLLRFYRKNLPWHQRWLVALFYPICNSRILIPVIYFWRNPRQLVPRMKARIKKIFGQHRK
jgi:glycosyltransferase involved in cell wall biosynthesis